MAERPNTVYTLLDKRREIAGRIDQAVARLRRMEADLAALDDVIRLFDPDAIPGPPKRFPTVEPVMVGEVARLIRVAFREADRPMTTREITLLVAEARGQDVSDPETFGAMRRRVSQALRRMQTREEITGELVGQAIVWERA
jgi:hypothetical protein